MKEKVKGKKIAVLTAVKVASIYQTVLHRIAVLLSTAGLEPSPNRAVTVEGRDHSDRLRHDCICMEEGCSKALLIH